MLGVFVRLLGRDDAAYTRNRFPRPVRKEAVAADWRGRGFDFRSQTHWVGQVFEEVSFDFATVVCVFDGSLKISAQGKTWVMTQGDELKVPKWTPLKVRTDRHSPTHWAYGHAWRDLATYSAY